MSGLPIDFVVAGGRGIGLGHVVRSARLAREATRRGFRVRAFLDGDAVARERWESASDLPAGPAARPDQDFAPLVALDTPDDKSPLLRALADRGCRALIIDDVRETAPLPTAPPGWRLLPGLHHRPVETSGATDAQGNALLSGPAYAILPEAHRRLGPIEIQSRTGLLISLGGADPHRAAPHVARGALDAVASLVERGDLPASFEIEVVFGPAFDDPGGRDADRLREEGCFVLHALDADEMADRMRATRLAVVGFGTSLTELAWHATPFLTLTHHDSDRGPARDLEAIGVGRFLGSARRVDRAAIEARIRSALLDPAWLRESGDRARRSLEGGLGAARVFERIEADLALRPTRQGSRRRIAARSPSRL